MSSYYERGDVSESINWANLTGWNKILTLSFLYLLDLNKVERWLSDDCAISIFYTRFELPTLIKPRVHLNYNYFYFNDYTLFNRHKQTSPVESAHCVISWIKHVSLYNMAIPRED